MNAIHRTQYGKKQIKKQMLERLLFYIMRMRYKEAWICFKGVQDFLLGINFIINTDVELLHKEIMDMGYSTQPKDTVSDLLNINEYQQSLKGSNEKILNKIIRWLTLNGLLFPAKRVVTVSAVKPYTNIFYRTKTAIHYEKSSQKVFITERSFKETIKLFKGYISLCFLIDKKYDIAKKEYHDRYKEITNFEFWNKYLDIEK